MPKNAIVEIAVKTSQGKRVPLGLVNIRQALSLPAELDIIFSHPEEEAGFTEIYIGRDEFKAALGLDGRPSLADAVAN